LFSDLRKGESPGDFRETLENMVQKRERAGLKMKVATKIKWDGKFTYLRASEDDMRRSGGVSVFAGDHGGGLKRLPQSRERKQIRSLLSGKRTKNRKQLGRRGDGAMGKKNCKKGRC